MPTQLPLELLTAICDMVATDVVDSSIGKPDTTTLRHCALVAPRLTLHCQKHLFSHIQIRFDNPHVISNLQQVLDDHPKLGSYTKILSVIFHSSSDMSHRGLASILRRFTQVSNLTVGGSWSLFYNIDWDLRIPPNVRLAMESIIHSSTCKILDFNGLRMPLSIFYASSRNTSLESLSFSKRTIARLELVVPPVNLPEPGPSYSSLRYLSILPSLIPPFLSPRFQDGRYLFDLTNLRTLCVDHANSQAHPNMTVQILDRVPSLQSFSLKLGSNNPTLIRDIFNDSVLCFAKTLTELQITLASQWFFVCSLPDKDPFAGSLSGLKALSRRNVLRTIYIKVDLDELWWEAKIVQESWLCGATTFSDPGSFPCLKEVTLKVTALKMPLLPDGVHENRVVSGEQHVEDLLDIPFHTLDLPYRFNFSAQAV